MKSWAFWEKQERDESVGKKGEKFSSFFVRNFFPPKKLH
jgi:hypothetical protein